MKHIVQIPDDIVERVRHKLPPPEVGILEAVALDALLGFLQKLEDSHDMK